MSRKEHSFLSTLLKSQIFIPSEIEKIGGNEIRFNKYFTQNSQNTPIYSIPYFKIEV